jgi:putative membrane protein insertion efficiency factor
MRSPAEIIGRTAKLLAKSLVHFYRYSFASIFGGQCRFEPSCSAYALEAIDIHGAWKGSGLAVKRICRCHPFVLLGGGQGHDPVPPYFKGRDLK